MTDQQTESIWTTAYTPSGYKMSFTITAATNMTGLIQAALEFDNLMTANGFTAREVIVGSELQEGEVYRPADHVLRTSKLDSNGKEIPVIAFYFNHIKWETKVVHKYMDKDADIADFLKATGLQSIDAVPYFKHGPDDAWPNYDRAIKLGAIPIPELKLICKVESPSEKHKFGRVFLNGYAGVTPSQQQSTDNRQQPSTNSQQSSQDQTDVWLKWVNWANSPSHLDPAKSDYNLFELEDMLDLDFDNWPTLGGPDNVANTLQARYEELLNTAPAQPKGRELPADVISKLKKSKTLTDYQKGSGYSWPEIINAASAEWREDTNLKVSDTREIAQRAIDRVNSHHVNADNVPFD